MGRGEGDSNLWGCPASPIETTLEVQHLLTSPSNFHLLVICSYGGAYANMAPLTVSCWHQGQQQQSCR